MKTTLIICLPLLLLSCFSRDRETRKINRLNQRITHLEQRINSLTDGRDTGLVEIEKMSGRCQAITKRGKQCKRNAKYNGYCWQHGG